MDDIKPEKAMSLYLESKENEVAQATLYSHKSRLGHFLRWCEKTQIVTMSELDPAHLHQYRMWRRSEGDLNRVTEKTQMDTLRVFVRWCERNGLRPDGPSRGGRQPVSGRRR